MNNEWQDLRYQFKIFDVVQSLMGEVTESGSGVYDAIEQDQKAAWLRKRLDTWRPTPLTPQVIDLGIDVYENAIRSMVQHTLNCWDAWRRS